MALRDVDIERYSRQIILPEVGGRGQERILAAAVAVAGTGELAAIAARYLAGAGVGTLLFDAAAGFGEDLRRLNPEVRVREWSRTMPVAALVAADLPMAMLDDVAREARTRALPLLAAGHTGNGGWLFVSHAGGVCAVCAAHAAALLGPSAPTLLDAVVTGVLGSMLALAALERILGLDSAPPPLRWFAAETSLLTALPVARRDACQACA